MTVYGPLAEIWFDGGILRPEKGGPDIPGLLARIAPDLICFGGCPGIKMYSAGAEVNRGWQYRNVGLQHTF